ncbi:N-acetylglucosamine kinase [Agrobacterium sp. SHOUNA12C]|uniref:ATPase BadF/BadG/BcrA/BcrD type domain-containing protein n=1 Tax=Rhizobium rhizogenes NBRC 13257 TaxID=1220581 RepID=A0AA87U4F3_RHIRH|nr:N-acetylglucosamine kinase [Rhizobium rhizogenes]KAA6483004.1 N-acetylglucosamine kinase [Agrobacterium sp. ICMP 7243]MCJ9719585.1 N-acetylglucosamine kinase [Agrobacterium sp. BETTINA12B]MCJ9759332.1 N-acetylglucosamine kinase [Agrobacterium sp. SHOUNA12C]OCJ02088.1 N-acetylglucosamine kinase [Agrobacterium sp. 13-626]OCJ15538.1 N-acetylglucosamine kinase [Agrobacterium sp. B133/95]
MSAETDGTYYFLGIDGGGTGCRARIEDAEGSVLGQGLSGPATTRLGIEEAWASIARAFGAAIEEAGLGPDEIRRIHAGVGLAGIGRKGALEALRAIKHPFASIDFVSDGEGACLGAHLGRDGAIVIAGTGSIGLGLVKGRQLRVGGYGFPISDEGSGAYLGLKAVQLALRAHDGRYEKTALLAEIMQRFQHDPMEAVAWMDRASATDYAALAPMVMRHADQGDAAGRRIVQNAAEHIDTLIRTLFDKGAPRVSLLGGLSSPLEPWLAPDVRRRLKPIDGDAVSGAIILARKSSSSH